MFEWQIFVHLKFKQKLMKLTSNLNMSFKTFLKIFFFTFFEHKPK